MKKVYSVDWTKDYGEDCVSRQSDYGKYCKYVEEPFNTVIKMTVSSGTMTIDAIWIYK